MADDGKVSVALDRDVDPFGETKTQKAPPWLALRPKLFKEITPIPFKRVMTVDPRKWKKKDLEEAIYTVARYELKVFAVQLSTQDKKILATLPKADQAKKKFPKDRKAEEPDTTKAIDVAELEIRKGYRDLVKKIEDKVSLALDEVESGKADNAKALHAGKDAIKRFEGLDTKGMFSKPLMLSVEVLKRVATGLSKNPGDRDHILQAGLQAMRKVESNFERTAKTTGQVAQYFLQSGARMAKDSQADPKLQDFGAKLSRNGAIKTNLNDLVDAVDDFGEDLDKLINFLARGDASAKQVVEKAVALRTDHEKKEKTAATAVKVIHAVAEEYKKLEKQFK